MLTVRTMLLATVACSTPPGQAASPAQPPTSEASVRDYPAICAAIAGEIESLRPRYPQLADYRADSARSQCSIDYAYHTHRESGGGWSGGVPHPDRDGIWFYIGLWDRANPASARQLDTQPDSGNQWIRDRRVTFLVLEGTETSPVEQELRVILERHGMVAKPR